MKNTTIVDIIRIPVNDKGDLAYDLDSVKEMLKTYSMVFPDHIPFAIPNDITIWQDLDINTLKMLRDSIDNMILAKENDHND